MAASPFSLLFLPAHQIESKVRKCLNSSINDHIFNMQSVTSILQLSDFLLTFMDIMSTLAKFLLNLKLLTLLLGNSFFTNELLVDIQSCICAKFPLVISRH